MWCFLFLLFASVIFNSLQYKFNIDCMNGNDKGAKYKGKVNITETGQPCINWSAGLYLKYRTFDGNFCRNPDNSEKTWCYVSTRPNDYKFCNVTYCGYLCPDLNTNEHMISPTELVLYRVDDRVTFKCHDGYTLIGSSQSTCVNKLGSQAMATWTNKQPKCEAVTCSTSSFSSVVDLNPSQDNYEYSTSVNISCRLGYTGTSVRSTCLANRRWSIKPPKCLPVTCSQLNLAEAVDIRPKQDEYTFNTSVDLSCHLGYTGASVRSSCIANRTWSLKPPNCIPTVCPDLKGEPHMILPKRLTGYRYGEVVIFNCEAGYTLNMNTTLKCLAQSQKSIHGKWNSSQPECISTIVCHQLTVGERIVVNALRTTIHFNEPVTLSCKEGFTGSSIQMSCKADGTWPNQRPSCTPVNCKSLNLDLHVKSSIKFPKFRDRVTLSCEEGYFSKPVYITCDANGNWPSVRPNCTEKSKCCKDSTEKRCSCMSYGLCGGTFAVFVAISTGVHIATCFYFRKREGKSATVYEDMQFKTVERQNGSSDETYTELT